MGEGITKNC
jgi:hypothetical protein